MNNLLEIKSLFFKLASASMWCRRHELNEQARGLIDGYYEELERLGVWREFAESVFVFGIDGETAYRAWRV